jgi:hypothetical protein
MYRVFASIILALITSNSAANAQISLFGLSWDLSTDQQIRTLVDAGLMAYTQDQSEQYCVKGNLLFETGSIVGPIKYKPDFMNNAAEKACESKYPRECAYNRSDGWYGCGGKAVRKPCIEDGKLDSNCPLNEYSGLTFYDADEVANLSEPYGTGNARELFYIESDEIQISCNAYNGCEYETEEIAQWLLDNIGNALAPDNGYVSMTTEYDSNFNPYYCGRGSQGDRVCALYGKIVLYKDAFGSGGLTLSLN